MSPSETPEQLRDKEDRLRFLLSKIDAELKRFQALREGVQSKKNVLLSSLKKEGIEPLPIELTPSESMTLAEDVDEHIASLGLLKNKINMKLKNVLREEELIESLKKQYGENVKVERDAAGAFKIKYSDQDTEKIYAQVKMSKKLVESLKKDLQEMR